MRGRRALPELTELTAAHWTSGESGRLSVQRCVHCLRWSFPPASHCRHCWREDFTYEPVTGKGALLSWTEVFEPVASAPPPPYLVAVVELEEGVRLLLGLTDAARDALRVGAPTRLVFEPIGEGVWLPLAELEEWEQPEDRLEAVS